MSGICALVNKDGAPVTPEQMRALAGPLSAGGPGTGGMAISGSVGVAFLDRFGGGRGFLHEDDALLVACSAEIYNHRDFSREEDFSEAALIAALFREQGKDWIKKVNGSFAAFVWDKRARSAHVFTDRIGVRPMVYHEDARRLCAASSVLSVAALPGFRRETDRQALYSLIQMEMIPTPFTIFKGIRKLESGHALVHRDGTSRVEMLWDMAYPAEKVADLEEMKARAMALLEQSVSLRLDYRGGASRVGCFLSGGIDSSTIAGLVHRLRPGEARTYSIGFDEPGYDEMEFARIAARAFHTRHNEYYVTAADVLDMFPGIVQAYDEPFANSSVIPAYFCARMAEQQGMRAMLGGDGGDEIFGGNARYHEMFALGARSVPGSAALWALLRRIPEDRAGGFLRKARGWLMRRHGSLEERFHGYSLADYIPPRDIFAPGFWEGEPLVSPSRISAGYLDRVRKAHPLDQYLYNDLKLTLMDNDLRKVERMTALAGVTARYPFLDHLLVEFTGKVPPELKVKDGRLRYFFKEAAAGLLPREILEKTKHGFGIPVSRWMMRPGKLNEMLKDALFSGSLERRGLFRKGFVEELYRRGQADGGAYYGIYLYYVLFLESWMRAHMDGASRPG